MAGINGLLDDREDVLGVDLNLTCSSITGIGLQEKSDDRRGLNRLKWEQVVVLRTLASSACLLEVWSLLRQNRPFNGQTCKRYRSRYRCRN